MLEGRFGRSKKYFTSASRAKIGWALDLSSLAEIRIYTSSLCGFISNEINVKGGEKQRYSDDDKLK